jgi:hypothetical protein
MHHLRFAFSVCAMLGWLAVACVSNVDPKGGDRLFDAAAPPAFVGPDSGVVAGPLSTNTGHTFTNLYDDYFGPPGKGSCSGDGTCHGGPDQTGAKASAFFCPDKATCFKTLTGDSGLVAAATEPTQTGLYTIIRKVDGGTMPKRPATIVFQASDLKRITDWIAAGAPND